MQSRPPKLTAVLVGGAFAALQGGGALAATPRPDWPIEAPIMVVRDARQLREALDLHDFAEQARNDVHEAGEHGSDVNDAKNDAQDAKNDAQNAQQDAAEAKQEGKDEPNGQSAGSNFTG